MTKKRIIAGVGLAFAITIISVIAWQIFRPQPPADLLSASGRIEGRITVVTPRTTGTVVQIRVDEGNLVVAGDLLAILDDPAIQSRVEAAEQSRKGLALRLEAADRNLDMTRAQIALQEDQAEAGLRQAAAQVERVRASATQAAKDADRARDLAAQKFFSEQAAEAAALKAIAERNAVLESEALMDRARKQLELSRLGRQQLDVLRAERDALARQVAQADAVIDEQRGYVKDFRIVSPLRGVVLTRNVELGERVNPGTPLFTLVDLDELYLKIYIPEPDIGKVALGQEARIYVNAYPDRAFAARVSKVASQAEFTPKNVETREERVKLVFAVELAVTENPGGVLKPGMPADGVVRLAPNAAWVRP